MKRFILKIEKAQDIDRVLESIHSMTHADREMFIIIESYGKEDLKI